MAGKITRALFNEELTALNVVLEHIKISDQLTDEQKVLCCDIGDGLLKFINHLLPNLEDSDEEPTQTAIFALQEITALLQALLQKVDIQQAEEATSD